MNQNLWAALSAFIASLLLTALLWRYPLKKFIDLAGERSLHTGSVPRSGGIAMVLAMMIGMSLSTMALRHFLSWEVVFALGLVVAVSFIDDVKSLPALWRLMVQFLSSAIIVFAGDVYFMSNDSFPLLSFQIVTVVGLVWLINLYNFMDGMDGFAAGMALFGFGSYALLGFLQGDTDYAWWNVCLLAAVAGFWCWNFPPARIFMGDGGAVFLGALAGVMAMSGIQRGLFPLWVPVVLFSPFWVDASYTLLCRLVAGEAFWQAHRQHIYQRLVSSGHSHRRVVLGEYALMASCAASVVLPVMWGLDYNIYPPLFWGLFYLLLLVGLEHRLPGSQK